jgi:hypothetical protein
MHMFTHGDHKKAVKAVRALYVQDELAADPKAADAAAAAAAALPRNADGSVDVLVAVTAAAQPSPPPAHRRNSSADAEEVVVGVNPENHYVAVGAHERDAGLPKVAVYSLPGYLTYASAQGHRDRVRALFLAPHAVLADVPVVTFSLVECVYADPDALEAVGELLMELKRASKVVFMLGFQPRVRKMLRKAHWFHDVRSFADYGSLLQLLRASLHLSAAVAAAGPASGSSDSGHADAGGGGGGGGARRPAPGDGDGDVDSGTVPLAPHHSGGHEPHGSHATHVHHDKAIAGHLTAAAAPVAGDADAFTGASEAGPRAAAPLAVKSAAEAPIFGDDSDAPWV